MTNKVIGITGEEIKKGDWMIRGEDGKYYKLRTKKVRACPILLAGAEPVANSFFEESTCADESVLEERIKLFNERYGCKGDMCEWYGRGCPAHPTFIRRHGV